MDPRGGLDNLEKRKLLPPLGLELQPLRPPVRSQSLSRLSQITVYVTFNPCSYIRNFIMF
jgi:hypothetical protein